MMYTYDPSYGDGDAAYIPFGTYRRDNISVNADRDMELLPRLTLNYEKQFENSELKAMFVAESTTFKRDYLMGSRTDPLSFEAPYLNYSSEAEKDNAEIFSEMFVQFPQFKEHVAAFIERNYCFVVNDEDHSDPATLLETLRLEEVKRLNAWILTRNHPGRIAR